MKIGCLIVVVVAIIGMVATCSILQFQKSSTEPPEAKDARYAIEIRNDNYLVAVYIVDGYIETGKTIEASEYWFMEADKTWRLEKKVNLKLTADMGSIRIIDRLAGNIALEW